MSDLPLDITKIIGKIKSDNWGGTEYIANLISTKSKINRYSEYWLGVHPLYPSTLAANTKVCLLDYIVAKLGLPFNTIAANFPFLLKILDVEKMLSIQVHPNKANAKMGFEIENEKKIKISAKNRTYKDPNTKYEALFSITEFYLLQGFLERDKLVLNLEKCFPIKLKDDFINGGYQNLIKNILVLSNDETATITSKIFQDLMSNEKFNNKQFISYWIAKYLRENRDLNVSIDKGILFMYLLNLIRLNKGEVIYTKPQVLHSYLYGKCIEVMSNSDNVIRLGLTQKYINHTEIYNNLNFNSFKPTIVNPSVKNSCYKKYIFEEANFSFTIIDSTTPLKTNLESLSIEIILILQGLIGINYNGNKIIIKQGEAAIIWPKTNYQIEMIEPSLAIIVSSISSFI